MKPYVSIIIPVYNTENYIKRCIDSILAQTYEAIEIILVNDGSTDSSGIICNEYALDSKVKVIHKDNGGVSSARNAGIDTSCGEYILFCDSDDYMEKECVSMSVQTIVKQKADIVIYSYFEVYGNSKNKKNIIPGLFSKESFLSKFEKFSNYMYFNSPFNKLYKSSIIKNNNIRFIKNLQMGEDLLFNLDYFAYCESFYILDVGLYNYEVNNSLSLTHRYFDNFGDIQNKLMKSVVTFFEKNLTKKLVNTVYLNNYLLFNLVYTIRYYLCAPISSKERKHKIKSVMKKNSSIIDLKIFSPVSVFLILVKVSIRCNSYFMIIIAIFYSDIVTAVIRKHQLMI